MLSCGLWLPAPNHQLVGDVLAPESGRHPVELDCVRAWRKWRQDDEDAVTYRLGDRRPRYVVPVYDLHDVVGRVIEEEKWRREPVASQKVRELGTIGLRCSGATCSGKILLWHKNILFGQASYSLAAGKSVPFAVRLSAKAMRMCTGGHSVG